MMKMMDISWRFGDDRDDDDDDDNGQFFWKFGAHWCEDCVEILRPILRSSLRQEMVLYRQGNFETRDGGTLQTRDAQRGQTKTKDIIVACVQGKKI